MLYQGQDVLGADLGVTLGVALDGVAAGVHGVAELVHRDVRGHLARGVAAHPVGHDEQGQLLVDQEVVLVDLALAPDVGSGPEAQLHVGLGSPSGP
jgi:hypothetical protein